MPNGLTLAISLLIVLLFSAYIVSIIMNFFNPFYSTSRKSLKKIIKKFNLEEKKKFADLGSGDGRVIFATNKMYNCLSVGYEISPILLIAQKLGKIILAPFNKNIVFKEESFFNISLQEYDVIYCCLPSSILENLEEKFEKELKKDCKVFSYKSSLPKKEGKKHNIDGSILYEYTYPSN
jgi:SAM-dependent methyltransferase